MDKITLEDGRVLTAQAKALSYNIVAGVQKLSRDFAEAQEDLLPELLALTTRVKVNDGVFEDREAEFFGSLPAGAVVKWSAIIQDYISKELGVDQDTDPLAESSSA